MNASCLLVRTIKIYILNKNYFITFEGIDGSGKSTQAKLLVDRLSSLKIENLFLREPGGTTISEEIRTVLLNNRKDEMSSRTEALLMCASRAQLTKDIIIPEMKAGKWIIADRFADSTLAYQGYGRHINLEIIKNIESIVCQGEHPDLTIFLEISAEESILRRKNLVPDRIESEGVKFLQKVNEGFKLIAKEKNWKVISATQNINSISNEIKETLIKNFS